MSPSIINSTSFYHIAVYLFWRFANVFFCLLVYLYCHCFFVLSCWCCCCYILSFLVDFYCLYMLRKVSLSHSICLIFWGFVLNYNGWAKKNVRKIRSRMTKIKGKFWQKTFYTLYYKPLSICRPKMLVVFPFIFKVIRRCA